jgi:hypothetical protein
MTDVNYFPNTVAPSEFKDGDRVTCYMEGHSHEGQEGTVVQAASELWVKVRFDDGQETIQSDRMFQPPGQRKALPVPLEIQPSGDETPFYVGRKLLEQVIEDFQGHQRSRGIFISVCGVEIDEAPLNCLGLSPEREKYYSSRSGNHYLWRDSESGITFRFYGYANHG